MKQGRIWAYVRDQRPWASSSEAVGQRKPSGAAPPGVVYRFSADRKGEHPRRHLKHSSGILQADAYSGSKDLYARRADDSCQFREAACRAHLRRDFHDIWKGAKSAIAREALDRIGVLYDIEREIAGQSSESRRAVRQEKSKPKVDAFREWAEQQLTRIPGKGELAKAFRYGLSRWSSFTLFLEDGRVAIDNNAAERAMRPIALGRKNWLFAGADTGGETLARAMTLIETAKNRKDERPEPRGLARVPAVNSESLPSMSCPDGEAGQRPTLPTGGRSCGAATRGYTVVFCGRLPQVAASRRPPRVGRWPLAPALSVADYPADVLADVLDRIQDHKINRIDELLPWNRKPGAKLENAA